MYIINRGEEGDDRSYEFDSVTGVSMCVYVYIYMYLYICMHMDVSIVSPYI
jgi:hypothetical protein